VASGRYIVPDRPRPTARAVVSNRSRAPRIAGQFLRSQPTRPRTRASRHRTDEIIDLVFIELLMIVRIHRTLLFTSREELGQRH